MKTLEEYWLVTLKKGIAIGSANGYPVRIIMTKDEFFPRAVGLWIGNFDSKSLTNYKQVEGFCNRMASEVISHPDKYKDCFWNKEKISKKEAMVRII